MGEFKQFLEIFGQFNYFVPQDKEQQIYDFYMFAALRGVANKRNTLQHKNVAGSKPFYEPGNFDPGNLEDPEAQADYMLEEVGDKLLPYLKKELTDVCIFSVCAEIKNVLYFNDPYVLELIVEKHHQSSAKKFYDFLNELVTYMEPVDDTMPSDRWSDEEISNINRTEEDPRNKRELGSSGMLRYQKNPNAKIVQRFAKSKFTNIDEFMSICKTLFKEADWQESYGGKPWMNIVDAYFRLSSSSSKNQLIVAIDHVYDLQHNTGSVFTKHDSYAKKVQDGPATNKAKYGWIQQALDHKRDVKSVKDFLDKVSPQMRKLAQRIISLKNLN